MKVGDSIPVTIAGQVVCNATVKEMQDGTATLVVPATLVVMGTRTELTNETREAEGKEVIITGVDREGSEDAGLAPEKPEENNVTDQPVEINEAAETDGQQ